MLTYQEGNVLYIEHQFLKGVIAQCRSRQDPMSFRVGWMLEGKTIEAPLCYQITDSLRYVGIYWIDEKSMRLLFRGKCAAYENFNCAAGLTLSAELRFEIQISAIENFDSSATNGYFPVEIKLK